MTNQPTPVILSDEALSEIAEMFPHAEYQPTLSPDEVPPCEFCKGTIDDHKANCVVPHIHALCQTVRAQQAALRDMGQRALKWLERYPDLDAISLVTENAALREQLAQHEEVNRQLMKDLDRATGECRELQDERDAQVLNDIRQRVADGYESASSRNVITVAALTLKDLHYVLSSHDGQFIRGATRMRDKCVEAIRGLRDKGMNATYQAAYNTVIRVIESLTLDSTDQMKEKQ